MGPNGIGKTTLLLILAGLQEPTTGTVDRRDDLTLGYLRQEAVLTFAGQDNTVYEEMLTVFADLRQQEADMRQLEALMGAGDIVGGSVGGVRPLSKTNTNTAAATNTSTTSNASCSALASPKQNGKRRSPISAAAKKPACC